MQTVAEGTGFVTAVDGFSLAELFCRPDKEILRRELLRGLWCSVVDLPDHPIAVGMNVDAQLDALGFECGLCWSGLVGIGVCFHSNLV